MDGSIADEITWPVILEGLSREDLRRVSAVSTRREFAAHGMLFVEGVYNSSVYIVEAGRARAFFNDVNGREFTTLVAGRGAVLGVVTCLTDSPPVLSVQALGKLTVYAISKRSLEVLLREIPVLAQNFIHLLALNVRDHMVLAKRARDTAPVRLAKVLRRLAALDQRPSGASETSVRGLTQQELATIVGSSRTWVALMLSSFEKEGVIVRRRGKIVIPDRAALSAMIERLEGRTDRAVP